MPLSSGAALPDSLQEYEDTEVLRNIRSGNILGLFESKKFDEIKKRYGLAEEYNLL